MIVRFRRAIAGRPDSVQVAPDGAGESAWTGPFWPVEVGVPRVARLTFDAPPWLDRLSRSNRQIR